MTRVMPCFSAIGQCLFEPFGADFDAVLVAQAVAIAGEDDDVFGAEVGGGLDVAFEAGGQGVVVFAAVESFFDAAEFHAAGAVDADAADHGAGEAVFLERGKVGDADEVDRGQADFLAGAAEVIERDAVVAPFAGRVVDAAFEAGGGVGGLEAVGEAGGDGGGGRVLKERAAGGGG